MAGQSRGGMASFHAPELSQIAPGFLFDKL